MEPEMIDKLLKKMELDLHKVLKTHSVLRGYVKQAFKNIKKKPNIFRLDLWYRYYQDVRYIKNSMPLIKKIRTVRKIYNKRVWELEELKMKASNPWHQ
ncbi:MAG: hypothetical protein VW963_03305 [Candidatus Neomarinimicrobiota bacterium]|jgi:hypothetical protein